MPRFLSYPHVVSTLALVVACSGTAYAAVRITGADVVDGSLTGKDLKNGSVKSADVAGLTPRDFAAGAFPGVRVYASDASRPATVPAGAYEFPMDEEAHDTGRMYDEGDSFVTVRQAGTYLVSGQLTLDGGANVQRQARILVNGDIEAVDAFTGDATRTTLSVSAVLRLAKGDRVSLGTFADEELAITDFNTRNDVWLSAQWLAP